MPRSPYPSDLTDQQWMILNPVFAKMREGKSSRGRPRDIPCRELVDAMLYLARTGCAWRMLPHDFPKWELVNHHFMEWSRNGFPEQINRTLRRQIRIAEGGDPEPSAAVIDSQTVQTTDVGGPHGYDAGKKNGRKRHILVDKPGLLLLVVVHGANIQDRDGAKLLLFRAANLLPRLSWIWADGGYAGKLIDWVERVCRWTLKIVKRTEMHCFRILPHRWVVERTFGWFGRWRRLSKDYERTMASSEGFVYLASIGIMIRRMTRPKDPELRLCA